MVMGYAAGVAAKLAVESRKAVQKINRQSLQNELRKQGAARTIPAGYPRVIER